MSIYDLTANKPNHEEIKFSDFKGKPILVVNTATQCGLKPQFKGLEKLHQKYKDDGLIVIGFPCDQFGNQEPVENEEMEAVCQVNHGVTFQLTEKVDVNGTNAHPIFKYLKNHLGSLLGSNVKWNFTKFLINQDGKPVKRYSSITTPNKIDKDIAGLFK